MFQLLIETNNQKFTYDITQEKTYIGRSKRCDIVLHDPLTSRQNSLIIIKDGIPYIQDLQSKNGTFVNNILVNEKRLNIGDQIKIGNVKLTLRKKGPTSKVLFEDKPFAKNKNTVIKNVDNFKFPMEEHQEDGLSLYSTLHLGPEPLELPLDKESLKIAKREQSLVVLYKVARALNSTIELPRLLEIIMDQVLQTISAEKGFLMLKNEKGELVPKVIRNKTNKDIVVSKTLINEVVKKRIAVLISDVSDDIRFSNSETLQLSGIRSAMCVPLWKADEVIGLIHVDNTDLPYSFTQDDLELLTALAHHAAVGIEHASLYENIQKMFFETVKALTAAIDAKDKYTYGHSERVANISELIAIEMGMDEREKRIIKLTGLLHDIGKIGVDEAILKKVSPLTDTEFNLIKLHPIIGEQILSPISNFGDVLEGVRGHHEWYNGKGYPDGLKGEDIPLSARIIAVADTFDALTSDRQYRGKYNEKEALDEIQRSSSIQFDPKVVDAFISLYNKGLLINFQKKNKT
ncbi:MAG: HD domain-containing protein [Deltaproteobacteria bacterium]|nr:HD domain-containing protein [Deltaproteobacteria bacterium]